MRLVDCAGHYGNVEMEMLGLCSLMCTLLVNHLQNFPSHVGAFIELHSNANLSCLVNLALRV